MPCLTFLMTLIGMGEISAQTLQIYASHELRFDLILENTETFNQDLFKTELKSQFYNLKDSIISEKVEKNTKVVSTALTFEFLNDAENAKNQLITSTPQSLSHLYNLNVIDLQDVFIQNFPGKSPPMHHNPPSPSFPPVFEDYFPIVISASVIGFLLCVLIVLFSIYFHYKTKT